MCEELQAQELAEIESGIDSEINETYDAIVSPQNDPWESVFAGSPTLTDIDRLQSEETVLMDTHEFHLPVQTD
jgi:hypothetical protein